MPTLEAKVPDVAPRPQPRSVAVVRPWTRSWLYMAPGETMTFVWILAIHLCGFGAVAIAPFFHWSLWPGWPIATIAVGLTALGGLGTTVSYHRSLTHRAVVLHPAVEHFLTFFAMLNGSGTPMSWVANHRLHHATSDTDEDISSPNLGGFWWAHLRWLWQSGRAPVARYCPDLDRPAYRAWNRLQYPLHAIGFLGGAFFGFAGWLWLGPLRLLWALHAQCTINSVCHLGQKTATSDSSCNVAWLTPLHFLQGENWHKNHHAEPTDARIGQTAKQIDLGWWTIVLLERCGLASRIRRPRNAAAITR